MEQSKLSSVKDWRSDESVLKQDLLAQIAWVARLRWITIAILLFVITVGGPILKVLEQSFWLYLIVGVMALPNLMPCTYGVDRLSKLQYRAFWHFFGDITTLTALIYLTSESIENPFLLFFTFYIIIASIILPKRLSYLLAGLSSVLIGVIPFCGYYGILPHYNLNKYIPHELAVAMNSGQFMFPILFVFSSTLLLIVYITTNIVQWERDRADETRKLKRHLEDKIVELELTQQQVTYEHGKLTAILNCMQEGIVFMNSKGIVEIFNRAAVEMRDRVPHAENPLNPQQLSKISPNSGNGYPSGDPAIFSLPDQQFETTYALESTYASVLDNAKNPMGTVLVVRDIKDRKQAEQQLIFSAKMSAVGELSAGVAHEVNNPLDGLLNCIQRMQQDPGNLEQNTEYLELMAEAVGRIESTVQQLLDFSRPHELATTDVNLNHVVNRTVALIEYKATEKGIQIEKEFQEDMEAIRGDGHLLEQLTLNLALNAIAAMQYGGTLRFQTGYTISEDLLGESGIYLKVIDTGIGMTEEIRERIFEMFYTTSETGEGLGLGLAVSDWIVKKHQGVIEVESELGKGSTFCVKFPLIKGIEGRGTSLFGFTHLGTERQNQTGDGT